MDSYQPPSEYVDMSVNRLSGSPSVTLRDTNASVSVIDGNLFGCPLLSSDTANSGSSDVSCGSQSFDISAYTWLAVVTSVVVTIFLCLTLCSSSSVIRVTNLVLVWMKASHYHLPLSSTSRGDQISNSLPHTIRAVKVLEDVSSMSFVLLGMFLLAVMMVYVGLKLSGGTHMNSVYQVQYLYTVTAAFFTGERPAVVIWMFVVISTSVVGMLCVRSRPLAVSLGDSVSRISDSISDVKVYQDYQDSFRTLALQSTVTTIIVGAALAINFGFVEIVYFGHLSSSKLSLIQYVFAVLKSLFSSIVVPLSSKLIRKDYRPIYSMAMKIVVTTIAPAIAVVLTSPLCLRYYIFPRSTTESYMSVSFQCSPPEDGYNSSCQLIPGPVTTSFTPPWNYSHQCSSSFLVSYLQIFIYMYTTNGIIIPLIYLGLTTTYSSRRGSYPLLDYLVEFILGDKSPFSSIFTVPDNNRESSSRSSFQVEMSSMSSPAHHSSKNDGCSNETATNNTSNTNILSPSSSSSKYDFEVSDLVPALCVDITILLTFGLASPLLAIPISFSMIINTLLLRLALGRYIIIVSSAIGKAACYKKLEDAFQDAWKGLPGIINIIIIIVIIVNIKIIITIINVIIIITILIMITRFMGSYECIRWSVLVTVYQ